MPIIKHGYAFHTRRGSTRAYRKQRAALLATITPNTPCHICGQPLGQGPIDAHHEQAFADHGHAGPLVAAHQSCNRKLGRAPTPGGRGEPRNPMLA